MHAGDFAGLPLKAVVALDFARHYAEQEGHYDHIARERVVELWGVEATREILAYLRAISFGNLFGNTFDALLSQLRGRPASNSSLAAEIAVVAVGTFGVPVGIILWALPLCGTRHPSRWPEWDASSSLPRWCCGRGRSARHQHKTSCARWYTPGGFVAADALCRRGAG